MQSKVLNCPHCDFPATFNAPVDHINYPADIDYVIDFIAQRLNLAECKSCQSSFYLLIIIYVYVDNDLAFVYTTHEETINVIKERYLSADPTLKAAFSNEEAIKLMLGIIQADKISLYQKIAGFLQNHEITDQNRLTPIEYKIFNAGVEKVIPMKLATTTGQHVNITLENLYNHYTFCILLQCLSDSGDSSMLERTRMCLPLDCITDELLGFILGLCQAARDDQSADFYNHWQIQVICAVLHEIKGKLNPEVKEFTVIVCYTWIANISDHDEPLMKEVIRENRKMPAKLLSFGIFFECFSHHFNKSNQDYEIINYYIMVMDNYGWKDAFNEAMRLNIRISLKKSTRAIPQENPTGMVKSHLDEMKFTNKGKYATQNAQRVKDYLLWLVKSGLTNESIAFLEELLDKAIEHRDFVSAITISVIAIDCFNKAFRTKFSKSILQNIQDQYQEGFKLIKNRDLLDYYINAGNTYRFLAQFDKQLEFSIKAHQLFKKIRKVSGNHYNEGKKTIERNLSIAYRESGQYEQSLAIIKKLNKSYPADIDILLTLAAFYVETQQPEKILSTLRHVLTVKFADSIIEFGIKSAAAQAYIELGDHQEAWNCLSKLSGYINDVGIDLKIQLVNISLKILPTHISNDPFFIELNSEAERLIKDPEFKDNTYRWTTFVLLLSRYVFLGKIDEAKQLVEYYQIDKKIDSDDLFINFTLLKYFLALKDRISAVDMLVKILKTLPEQLPNADNKNFIVSWFDNKDHYQHELLKHALDFFLDGLMSAWTLLQAIEFQIGLDISARLANDDIDIQNLAFEEFCEAYPGKDFLVFFETDHLHLLQIAPDTRTIKVHRNIEPIDRVKKLKENVLRAYNTAFPSNLSIMDGKLREFGELLAKISEIINPDLQYEADGCYIVPGRALTNLPLHLINVADGKHLIERYPVSFLSNLTMLHRIVPVSSKTKNGLIVSVTKENDKPQYIELLSSAKKQLKVQFSKLGINVMSLEQKRATISSITKNLEHADEALLICHGIQYDAAHGPGLCVANSRLLPPGLMLRPIDEVKKFVLTWQDLEKIKSAPKFVLLAACSSGRIVLGKGAVNHSFDQAFFARGTQLIINPIWDTEQESNLFWLSSFYKIRADHPGFSMAKCYQAACLKTKQKYPHHYFWSPFILKGLI